MRQSYAGVAVVASLVWLAGCETSTRFGDLLKSGDGAQAVGATAEPQSTGSTAPPVSATANAPQASSPGLLGSDPSDDLAQGKKYYRSGNYGTAETHFRRAVERYPRDAEAWVGLAAAYDKLRRFDLADRAYAQATSLVGETPELMNNKGYSFILRGDYGRARTTLLAAQAKDPANPYIRSNLELLNQADRKGKAVQ